MSEINFLNIIQVLVAIALIGFILIQRGPGATAGSAFGGGGGGASGTVFGAKGSGSFLTKATALLATAFFIITMLIAIDASDTYASAGDAAEQDLGVFGSLEDAEPSMTTADPDEAATLDVDSGSDMNTDGLALDVEEATEEAVDAVEETTVNAADAVEEAAEDVSTEVEEATESNDDSDGDNN